MTYPVGAPTLSGALLTIDTLLKSPTQIRRRLQTLSDLRFVADQLLTQRFRSSGGAVLVEQNPTVINTRAVRAVAPGAEYPYANPSDGNPSLLAVQNWGQAERLTDARIKRHINGGDELDRVLRVLLNSIIAKVDAVAIAAIASNVTATQAAIAGWEGEDSRMLRDIELAKAQMTGLNRGLKPDTILMSDEKGAYFKSDLLVQAARRRETTDNPVYTGEIDRVAGLVPLYVPAANLPTDDVWIVDSTQLGGMADEQEVDPGYTVAEMGVQVQSLRKPFNDAWDVWARRITVPVVVETGAGIRITDTDGS